MRVGGETVLSFLLQGTSETSSLLNMLVGEKSLSTDGDLDEEESVGYLQDLLFLL